ncbi:DUF6215 domain-containing protein [Streptomyces sp. NPDC090025]|uniref:DUF6215 domain-containing protein n=1 Tax=Streptomyces sp. NPDC090025 TaxID=3365922 RepID=UPI00383659A1
MRRTRGNQGKQGESVTEQQRAVGAAESGAGRVAPGTPVAPRAPKERGPNVGAQVGAALALGAVLAGGFWYMAHNEQEAAAARGPAGCPAATAPPSSGAYLSGVQLCRRLNRPDLPVLLGIPDAVADSASGRDGKVGDRPSPHGQVQLGGYTLQLNASYDRLPVRQLGKLLPRTEPTTFQGRAAVLYSDRTIELTFDLGGKHESRTGPGGIARHLLVAKDPKDSGGSYELVIWRDDKVTPDDATLMRVAQHVLPTLPGWAGH